MKKTIWMMVMAAGLIGGCGKPDGGPGYDPQLTGYVIDAPMDIGPVAIGPDGVPGLTSCDPAAPNACPFVPVNRPQQVPPGEYNGFDLGQGFLTFYVTPNQITHVQLSVVEFDAPPSTNPGDLSLTWQVTFPSAAPLININQPPNTVHYAFPNLLSFTPFSSDYILAQADLTHATLEKVVVGSIDVADPAGSGLTGYDVFDSTGSVLIRSNLEFGLDYWLLPGTYQVRAHASATVLHSNVVVEALRASVL